MEKTSKKIKTSNELAVALGVQHKALMKFYWQIEDHITSERDIHRCVLVIGRKATHLERMAPALILVMIARFAPEKTVLFEQYLGTWEERVCPTCGEDPHDFKVEEARNCVPPRDVLQFGEYKLNKKYREALFADAPFFTVEEIVGSFLGHNPNFPDQKEWQKMQARAPK